MADDSARGTTLLERMIHALRLDLRVYTEISSDRTANGQAFTVVLLSGMCNGLGLAPRLGTFGVSAGLAAGILGWLLWSAVILLVARLLGHRRHDRSLLRALGFADAPGVLLIIGVVPVLGRVVRLLTVVWLLLATMTAVQAVFDVPRRRAAIISAVGFAVYLLVGIVSGYFAAA